ncbi:Uncharacterized protein dnm_009810 [Desulfonema magnum]|uniref:Uncharacterized protein n=1 Tax=Desulfonema magnum TaxID=45655 RepID=A0A975BGH5_9BACT|nr:Uncharacterized protein dnm_009810 [Desulfonema magnum]
MWKSQYPKTDVFVKKRLMCKFEEIFFMPEKKSCAESFEGKKLKVRLFLL